MMINHIKQGILHLYASSLLAYRPEVEKIDNILVDRLEDVAELSTNTVKIIGIGNKEYYFKECREHLPIDEYISKTYNDYIIENVSIEYQDRFLSMIRDSYSDSKRRKFLMNMGTMSDSNSMLNKALADGDYERIGLKLIDNRSKAELNGLIIRLGAAIETYKLNRYVKFGAYETYGSSRSIATYIISYALGIEDIVPKTKYCRVDYKGKKIIGIISDKCEGESPYKKDIGIKRISGSFQRDLSNLEVLDVICYQKDHGRQNYNIQNTNGTAIHLMAFDNDAPSTFFPTPVNSFYTYDNVSPVVLKNGIINRPFFDKSTIEKMSNIDYCGWNKMLSPYLSYIEILFSFVRMKMLLSLVNKWVNINKVRLLEKRMWNGSTINEELSGKYGMTSLCDFVQYVRQYNRF